jgi:hypothetical protein
MKTRWIHAALALGAALSLGLASGCECSTPGGVNPDSGPHDGGSGMDGSIDAPIVFPDAIYPDGGRPDAFTDTNATAMDANSDGGPVGCAPAHCGGMTYACGDCIDNDGDGLLDAADPDCIGPCSNNEAGYDLLIPGGDHTCTRDCFYDTNSGSGDDGCEWDLRCDMLEPDAIMCPYTGPGAGVRCPDTQAPSCATVCGPLTPNGCDCFGCCELPARSGQFVFLGSRDASGVGTCTLDVVDDPALCHPCTPVGECLNTCGHCELSLGATTLPDDCFPHDGGMPIPDDAVFPDGGRPDAFVPDAGMPSTRCDPGVQACGLAGDPPCPAGDFCLGGCCGFFG